MTQLDSAWKSEQEGPAWVPLVGVRKGVSVLTYL